jgi:hypothetical protein
LKNKTKRLIKENEVLKNEITELKRRNTEQENNFIVSRKGFFFFLNFIFLFYLLVILILLLLFLGRLINVKDVGEKKVILKSLKNIAVNTKEQCIGILNSFTMNTKILCFLPSNDRSDINIEVANEILNLLIKVSEKLFDDGDEEKFIQFRSKLEECDCLNTLLFLLNIYENISLKVRISIILGNFYSYTVIPNEGKIIINVLINYLKEQSTKKSNEDENKELMISVLHAFVNISVEDENRKIVLDGGIIHLLLPLVNSSNTNVWQNIFVPLYNICNIKSVEDKNSIINCDIFGVFHKRLLEILPLPPQKIIYCIIVGMHNLFFSNRFCVINMSHPFFPPHTRFNNINWKYII